MRALNAEFETQPAASDRTTSLARWDRYRELIRRRWWVVGSGLVIGLSILGAIRSSRPPLFTSAGRMIVSIKLAIPEGSVYSEELGNFLGTQAALMRSGVVLNRAQARVLGRDPGSSLDPIAVKVAISPKTSIFVLEATGPDPSNVGPFLQAVMEEYIQLKKEMRSQTSDLTVTGLTEQVVRLERELGACEEELGAFQRSNSIITLQEAGSGMGVHINNLNQRLAVLKAQEALLQSLSPKPGSENPPIDAEVFNADTVSGEGASLLSVGDTRQDTAYSKTRQELLLLRAEQSDWSKVLRPQHPKMVAFGEDIARRERLLNILVTESAQQLESRRASIARQVSSLERSLADWNAQALDCSRKMAEYQRFKANHQRVQTLYERLLGTLQTLDLNKEISPESVTILEPASGATPVSQRSVSAWVAVALLSLVASIGLLLFLDQVDDRLHSLTRLRDSFDEAVLAQIPWQRLERGSAEVPLLSREDDRHAFVEAYRSLRSSLLFLDAQGERPRTLLVTSSVPNEGKSITSANLAITMAHTGARVLLVDADLRKGAMLQRFGLEPGPGFSEVLANQIPWERAVHATNCPGLSLLPRGEPTSISGELFLAETARQFLAQAGQQYDYLILDAAPVMAADDVTTLAPQSDAVLFVLRSGHTSARVARAALELLYRRQVRILGLVFNAVRPRNSNYYPYQDRYSRPGTPSTARPQQVR